MRRGLSATLTLTTVLLLFHHASADCLAALTPFEGRVCSGFGSCINNTCVCDPGWSGTAFMFDRLGEDCETSEVADVVIASLTYASAVVTIVVCLWRLASLKPFSSTLWSLRSSSIRASMQRIVIALLTHALLAFAFFSLYLFADVTLSNNGWAAALWVLTDIAQNFYGLYFNLFWLRTVLDTTPSGITNSLVGKLRIATYADKSASLLFGIATFVGAAVAPREMKLSFCYAYFSCMILQILFTFVVTFVYNYKITQAIDVHLATSRKISAPGQREQIDSPLVAAAEKIRRVRRDSTVGMFLALACGVCSLAMPPITTYVLVFGRLLMNAIGASFIVNFGGAKPPPKESDVYSSSSSSFRRPVNSLSETI